MTKQSKKRRVNSTNNSKKNRKVMVGGAITSYKTFNYFEDFSTACESAKFRSETRFKSGMFSSKVQPTECERMLGVVNTILLSKSDSLKYIEFIENLAYKEFKEIIDALDERENKLEIDKKTIPEKQKLGVDVTQEIPRVQAEEASINDDKLALSIKKEQFKETLPLLGGQQLLNYVTKLYATKDVEHLKELLLILDPDFYKVLVDPNFYKVDGYTNNRVQPPNNYNKAVEGLDLRNTKIMQWVYDTNNELFSLKEPRDLYKLFERYQARGLNHYEKNTYDYQTDMTFSNARINKATIYRYKLNICWDLCFDVRYNGLLFPLEQPIPSQQKSVYKKIKQYVKLEKEYESIMEQVKKGTVNDTELATYIEKQENFMLEENTYLYDESNLLSDTYRFKLDVAFNIVEYNTNVATYRCFGLAVRESLLQGIMDVPIVIIGKSGNFGLFNGVGKIEDNISSFVTGLIDEIHDVFPGSDVVDPSAPPAVPYVPTGIADQISLTFVNDYIDKPEYLYLQRYVFLLGNVLLNPVITSKLFEPYKPFDLFSRYYDKDIDNSPNNPQTINPTLMAGFITNDVKIRELLPSIEELYFDFLYEHIPNYTDFLKDKILMRNPKIIDFKNNIMYSHAIVEYTIMDNNGDPYIIAYALQIIMVTNINSQNVSDIRQEAKMCFLWVNEKPDKHLFFDQQDANGDWITCLLNRSVFNPIREALLPRAVPLAQPVQPPPKPPVPMQPVVPADYQAILLEKKQDRGFTTQEVSDATGIDEATLDEYENGAVEPTPEHWQLLLDY